MREKLLIALRRLQKKPERAHDNMVLEKPPQNGFTLIELLVVICLIIVLIAVTLPAIGNAQRKAQAAGCANNLHQIDIALQLYISDNTAYPYMSHTQDWAQWNETLLPYLVPNFWKDWYWPPVDNWVGNLPESKATPFECLDHQFGQGVIVKATGALQNNMNNLGAGVTAPGMSTVFTCPTAPSFSAHDCYPWNQTTVHRYPRHYSANRFLFTGNAAIEYVWDNGINHIAPQVRAGNIARPETLIVLCDASLGNDWEASEDLAGPTANIWDRFNRGIGSAESANGNQPITAANGDSADPLYTQDTGQGAGWPAYRHDGRCNALMGDGRVQIFQAGQITRANYVSSGGNEADYGSMSNPSMIYP